MNEADDNRPDRFLKPVRSLLNLLTPTLRWFLLAMILANIAGVMLFSLLSIYMAEELGATVEQIGRVLTLAALAPLVMQVIGGWMGDVLGRLRVMAIGSLVACFGYVLMPLAPSWQWVLPCLLLEYVSGAAVGPSWTAFVAEQSTEETR